MTRSSVDDSSLREAVEAFVKERFTGTVIQAVALREDFDRDGDRVVEIIIAIDATAREIARREPPGFLRALRDMLCDLHETAFPIVSFKPTRV